MLRFVPEKAPSKIFMSSANNLASPELGMIFELLTLLTESSPFSPDTTLSTIISFPATIYCELNLSEFVTPEPLEAPEPL